MTSGGNVTPMIRQFREIKSAHPDTLLFYRMGDFYELFFDDAVQAAAALDIALTARGKHNGESIPMCGVPVHNAELYLQRLIKHGFRVAVCEQMEDPAEAKKRPGAQKLVKRDVVRIVTPGTLTEDELLDARANNYLAALASGNGDAMALAWLDLSTGEFNSRPVTRTELAAELARLAPVELLVTTDWATDAGLKTALNDWQAAITELEPHQVSPSSGAQRLAAAYGVQTIDAFGDFSPAERAAAGAVLAYVEVTQKGSLPGLQRLVSEPQGAFMALDPSTRRSLEVLETQSGERRGSLLHGVDRTRTAAGGRLLARQLSAPLTDREQIVERLAKVTAFVDASALRQAVRERLGEVPDLERALSRLTLGRGQPRDLAAVRDTLIAAAEVASCIDGADNGIGPPAQLADTPPVLLAAAALRQQLAAALAETVPAKLGEGATIRTGYDSELDTARSMRDRGRRHIADLEGRLRGETGIASLKIRHNNMLGYFVEVPAAHQDRVPAEFVRRQGLANASRFACEALTELELKLNQADGEARDREIALLDALIADVLNDAGALAELAATLSGIDVAAAWAELAVEQRWVRPDLTDDLAFAVEQGRHPVVEPALERSNQSFVPNDCVLKEGSRLWLLTGPNMAGKSTFLRQNALIAILAQTGAYVPATAARIGIVDRLFSRVGAADDLARGRSTFMVEMVETAAILHQATRRSMVILDEIGRGTATHDGLSIAWAVVEHLHEQIGCRGLFATHFHELTALEERLSDLACHAMRVREWRSEVVFLHEVGPGAADRSYGIHVARLAGLPLAAVARAENLLQRLEAQASLGDGGRLLADLPLFHELAAETPAVPEGHGAVPDRLRLALAEVDPDSLSPREALETVYRLKQVAASQEGDNEP